MKTYFATVHKDPDSAVGVVFPDLPGCFSAGDTYDEAIRNAGEALRLYADAMGEWVEHFLPRARLKLFSPIQKSCRKRPEHRSWPFNWPMNR